MRWLTWLPGVLGALTPGLGKNGGEEQSTPPPITQNGEAGAGKNGALVEAGRATRFKKGNRGGPGRPPTGNKPKSASEARIKDLIAQVKVLKADAEKLQADFIKVCAERDELKSREEDRLFRLEEDRKTAQAERQRQTDEYLGLCLGEIIASAKSTGTYERHPDFESKLKHAEYLTPRVLECVLQFGKVIAPELAYLLANDEPAHKHLAGLKTVAILSSLYPVAQKLQDHFKLQRLIGE